VNVVSCLHHSLRQPLHCNLYKGNPFYHEFWGPFQVQLHIEEQPNCSYAVHSGNGWFGLRELVRSCTSGCGQFPALSGVEGTSLAQVRRARGRERAWKRGARWDMDSDARREVGLGGNASLYSPETDPMLYTEVQRVSSVEVKSPCGGGMELTRGIKYTWAPCD
jgi:hypothetical protein